METPKPGIYPDASFEEYLSWDAASHSRVWPMTKSAALVRWNLDHPTDSKAMRFGRALHCALLEPDRFDLEYSAPIEGDGRTKAVKEARELQLAQGFTLLEPVEWGTLTEIKGFVFLHPEGQAIRDILASPGSMREVSLVWDQPLSDGRVVRCKCRPDIILNDPAMAADLKSTEDSGAENFPWDIVKYGYHFQAALVTNACTALGIDCPAYSLIALGKKPPYLCKAYLLDNLWFDMGNALLDKFLSRWATCVELDQWPGYGGNLEVLLPPPNAYKRVFGWNDEEVLS